MFLINESHLRRVAKKFCITRCFMQIFSLSAEIWGNSFSAQKISSLLPFDNNLLEFPMKFDIFHWVSEQYEHWKKLRQGLLKCFCMFLCKKKATERALGAPLRVIWQVNCLWIVTSHSTFELEATLEVSSSSQCGRYVSLTFEWGCWWCQKDHWQLRHNFFQQ